MFCRTINRSNSAGLEERMRLFSPLAITGAVVISVVIGTGCAALAESPTIDLDGVDHPMIEHVNPVRAHAATEARRTETLRHERAEEAESLRRERAEQAETLRRERAEAFAMRHSRAATVHAERWAMPRGHRFTMRRRWHGRGYAAPMYGYAAPSAGYSYGSSWAPARSSASSAFTGNATESLGIGGSQGVNN
jgi:hypothetical protein